MKKTNGIAITVALLIFSVFVVNEFSFSEEELYVEGISYESASPNESIAVINGTLLKPGDSFKNYRIVEVGSNFVKLTQLDGSGERMLQVTGGAPKAVAQPTPTPGETSVPTGLGTAGEGKLPTGQDLQKMMTETMAKSISALAHAKSSAGLADLRQIYTATNVYFSESGNVEGITFDNLIKGGMLSPAFQNGEKGDYRFTIKGGNEGVSVSASPKEKNSGLRHFFIDENGDVYAEDNKPATKSSPRYQPKMPF
jgi:hypothetical protein